MNSIEMSIYTTLIAVACFVALATASKVEEVCQWETFKARCADDEVIVMKQAQYGRMRIGKCLPHNARFVGCSADVTEYMHGRCSGRQNCEVPVPDPIMFAHQPCPKDLVAHLEAEYECVKVTKWDQKSCDNVLTATSGFIAKPTEAIKDIHMRHHCPHRIVAQPGQTIKVYLSDFFNKFHYQPSFDVLAKPAPVPDCINYGHITEDKSAPTGICGGQLQKDTLIYRSKSNVVDIMLAGPARHPHHYLIKFEVIGCPKNLEAPENGWIVYENEMARIHCNNSHTASELICENNKWVGEMQDCMVQEAPVQLPISHGGSHSFANTGLIIAIIGGITLGIAIGLAVLIITARRSKKAAVQQQMPIYQPTTTAENLQKSFNGSNQDSQYFPVVESNYVPAVIDDGTKFLTTSNPPHHIVNIPNFGNYAPCNLPPYQPNSVNLNDF